MILLSTFSSLFKSAPRANPADYSEKIRAGDAVLVDVREPAEWARGVAKSAALLPLSDLHRGRARWQPFLDRAAGRELLLYCVSGTRSGIAARVLAGEGLRAINAGTLADWADAGWPIVAPPSIIDVRKKGN